MAGSLEDTPTLEEEISRLSAKWVADAQACLKSNEARVFYQVAAELEAVLVPPEPRFLDFTARARLTNTDIARRALALFGERGQERWTQRAKAIDAYGAPCLSTAPEAVAWDLLGACNRVSVLSPRRSPKRRRHYVRASFVRVVQNVIGVEDVHAWHDAPERTFLDVADVLRKIASGRG